MKPIIPRDDQDFAICFGPSPHQTLLFYKGHQIGVVQSVNLYVDVVGIFSLKVQFYIEADKRINVHNDGEKTQTVLLCDECQNPKSFTLHLSYLASGPSYKVLSKNTDSSVLKTGNLDEFLKLLPPDLAISEEQAGADAEKARISKVLEDIKKRATRAAKKAKPKNGTSANKR